METWHQIQFKIKHLFNLKPHIEQFKNDSRSDLFIELTELAEITTKLTQNKTLNRQNSSFILF